MHLETNNYKLILLSPYEDGETIRAREEHKHSSDHFNRVAPEMGWAISTKWTQEQCLCWAILEEAWNTLWGMVVGVSKKTMPGEFAKLVQEAQRWYKSNSEAKLYDFCSICRALGLHPDIVRQSMRVTPAPRILIGDDSQGQCGSITDGKWEYSQRGGDRRVLKDNVFYIHGRKVEWLGDDDITPPKPRIHKKKFNGDIMIQKVRRGAPQYPLRPLPRIEGVVPLAPSLSFAVSQSATDQYRSLSQIESTLP